MNVSVNLNLKSIPNLRDLGGMKTVDNRRIKKGKLYRSGLLGNASQEDLPVLAGLDIVKIYDFRSAGERYERPDVDLPGCENIHLPIFEEKKMGVTREEETDKEAGQKFFGQILKNPDSAKEMMIVNYEDFVNSEFANKQYSRFLEDAFQTLSLNPEKAVLWHCSAGKDRAGFAAVLIEEILGISREDIFEDYLYTNEFMTAEAKRLMDEFRQIGLDLANEQVRLSLEALAKELSGAYQEYLDTCYQLIDEKYGGTQNFLEKVLGIDETKRQAWQDLLLED